MSTSTVSEEWLKINLLSPGCHRWSRCCRTDGVSRETSEFWRWNTLVVVQQNIFWHCYHKYVKHINKHRCLWGYHVLSRASVASRARWGPTDPGEGRWVICYNIGWQETYCWPLAPLPVSWRETPATLSWCDLGLIFTLTPGRDCCTFNVSFISSPHHSRFNLDLSPWKMCISPEHSKQLLTSSSEFPDCNRPNILSRHRSLLDLKAAFTAIPALCGNLITSCVSGVVGLT